MLVERDSVDGSLGNGVDCAWMLLRRCRSAGSIYLALVQLHSIFIVTFHIILQKERRFNKNYTMITCQYIQHEFVFSTSCVNR